MAQKKKTSGNFDQLRVINQVKHMLPNKYSIYDSPAVDRGKYQVLWQQYCHAMYVSQHKWKDLPFFMPSDKLETELYNKGWLLGYVYQGQPCISPAIPIGVNFLGMPHKYQGIDFLGQRTADNLIAGVNCVVLNSRIALSPNNLASGLVGVDRVLCADIAETFARLQVNLVNSSVKIVAVSGDSNANEILRKEIRKVVSSDDAVAVISSQFETANLAKSFAEIKFAEYIDLIKNYDSIRGQITGQDGNGAGKDKKQYVNETELGESDKPKEFIKDYNFFLRQEFCTKFNELTGANISVEQGGGNEQEQEDNTNDVQSGE